MSRPRVAAFVAVLGVLLAGGGAAGYFETHELRHHFGPTPAPTVSVPAALADATRAPLDRQPGPSGPGGGGTPARPGAVRQALAGPLGAPALGPRVLAQVVDVGSGQVLLADRATATGAPASTAKLLTAAAVLTSYPPTHRFTTTAVAGARPGTVVLVGGGDPTLTAAAPGHAGAYPDAARLSALAAQVKAALGATVVSRVVVDGTLFTGPAVSPAWAAEDVPSDYASAITALMADGGRAAPEDAVRSAVPDLAAGHAFARLLGDPAVPVVRGTAPAGAATLGRVESAPLSVLVEQMLEPSDNVIAEVLARQVALAAGRPASFTGAAAAIRTVLAGLGVTVGRGMRDGSGLAAADRLAPATLTALLRVIAGSGHPQLHDVLAGLPVAAWSGTLADRYLAGSGAAPGAGTVRAKTGTLTGVSALAGVVHDRSGRLLAFAFLADRVGPSATDTAAAEAALDRAAAVLSAQ